MTLPSLLSRRSGPAALLLGALLATATSAQTAPPAAPPGKLEIVERVHDVGRVERGTVVEHAFILKNPGNGPLTVDAKPGCGCTVVDFDKVIPPGGTGAVRAKLDTRMFKGDLTKSVTLDTNDPEQRQAVLELVAFVAVPIDIQPTEVIAIEGRRGEIAPVEIIASSPENVVFDVLSAESNDPSYTVKVAAAPADGSPAPKPKEDTLASGASRYAITVSVAKDVPPGRSGVQVLLKTTHPKAPEVPLQIYPNIIGDLSVNPERVTIRLSPTSPPETRSQHVAVRAVPGVKFEVMEVQSSNPLIKATVRPVSPGSEYDVTITYDGPPLTNVVDGHVNIVTNHEDQPVLPVVVYAFPEPQPTPEPPLAPAGRAPEAGAR